MTPMRELTDQELDKVAAGRAGVYPVITYGLVQVTGKPNSNGLVPQQAATNGFQNYPGETGTPRSRAAHLD
jgi:hypothetical protein